MLARSICSFALCASLTAQAFVAEPRPAGDGWRAHRIHASDTGVWYAHVDQVVDAFGQPEIVCADDAGNFKILSVYSGQWYTNAVRCDGSWLAPSRPADVDPRVAGRELYGAGQNGSVHQVTLRAQPFGKFSVESREIGHRGGEEFHAILAGDLIPGGGDELLVFGITGSVYRLSAAGDAPGAFAMELVARLPGRVRDVVLLPQHGSVPSTIVGASRTGHLLAMRLSERGLDFEVLAREDCGLGRVALRPGHRVVYATRDDGVLLRFDLSQARPARTVVYAGGQGLRGVAAGNFFADGREAVACYGYDQRVHMITPPAADGGRWQVETIYRGEHRGHWLTVGELDGRNGSDELVASGFGGDVVLLSRPPGYALPGAAVPDEVRDEPTPAASRPPRIAARIGARGLDELSPLVYHGGFESKALVYETLVRRCGDGRIVPGLAASWRIDDDGRAVTFSLRDGATWHDGSPVTADDVAMHFRRWVGLPEHDWLRSNRRIERVRAVSPRQVRVELDRPVALLADLCALNPCAIVGPSARDREGNFVRPVGSGPFAVVGPVDDGAAVRYRRHGSERRLDLWRSDGDALGDLLRGDVDAVVSSWLVTIDPARAATLRRDGDYRVHDGPGSAVQYLAMRFDAGPLASVGHRRAVARAIDREALVRDVMHGFADPCAAFAAPSILDWPAAGEVGAGDAAVAFDEPLGLDPRGADDALVEAVVAQLSAASVPVRVLQPGTRTADLWFERSHGVPYDPFSVVERFGPPAGEDHAATPPRGGRDAELAARVAALSAASDPAAWPAHYARIQQRLDELLPVVPLFVPRRIAVVRDDGPVGAIEHDMYRLPAWLLDALR